LVLLGRGVNGKFRNKTSFSSSKWLI
jgi:hypothetical protein